MRRLGATEKPLESAELRFVPERYWLKGEEIESQNANNVTVSGAIWIVVIPEFPSVVLLAFVLVLRSFAIIE